MPDRLIVTGAAGFLGRRLCEILAPTYHVVGADIVEPVDTAAAEWLTVSDGAGLARLVADARPSFIVHAAFINRKPQDWAQHEYLGRMLAVDEPLFQASLETSAKLLLVSSSAVYGGAGGNPVIDETTPPRPISLYGLAKTMQEELAAYHAALGLPVCVARLFNLIGPGQGEGMLLADWISQAWAVVQSRATHVQVLHRRSSRDFVDVRDAAQAVALLIEHFPANDIFNVASGEVVSLAELSDEIARICPVPLEFLERENTLRANDVLVQRGSYAKIAARVGWQPRTPWRESVRAAWDAYRDIAQRTSGTPLNGVQ